MRFQIIAGRGELCNAFGELNDPIDQKITKEQMKAQKRETKKRKCLMRTLWKRWNTECLQLLAADFPKDFLLSSWTNPFGKQ